jgi:hypothetical protein
MAAPSADPPVDPTAEAPAIPAAPPAAFAVGATVLLRGTPEFLKTADPMPMLRPPDLVDVEEVGRVVGLRALGRLAVRFRRGTFLFSADQLRASDGEERPSG